MTTDNDDDADLNATITSQLQKLRAEGKLTVQVNRRCRICRDDDIRKLVNTLAGYGLTPRALMNIVEASNLNKGRAPRDHITYDVVYRHLKNHFDIDTPARAIYTEIVSRRAAEEGKDYESAIGSAVNALSFLETVMVRGFADAQDENTKIPYNEGLRAAVKLHELTRVDAGVQEMAEVMRKMNFVINAVMTHVPEQYHPDILVALEGKEPTRRVPQDLESEAEDFDPDVEDEDEEDF